ncbi:hypothetical protein AVEN_145646-1 [Araneus ventricosus]|uniref:Uncharacterized protein n=1 Tax=Araneus ventricosus TaxID=182803 RepID=A0A4Y2Q3T2_ARAVE|nr:hypothetical protein AVEN_145646-1 [Araneus ventricosus]
MILVSLPYNSGNGEIKKNIDFFRHQNFFEFTGKNCKVEVSIAHFNLPILEEDPKSKFNFLKERLCFLKHVRMIRASATFVPCYPFYFVLGPQRIIFARGFVGFLERSVEMSVTALA